MMHQGNCPLVVPQNFEGGKNSQLGGLIGDHLVALETSQKMQLAILV